MLIRLKIKNYAIVKDLEINFSRGLTCITGETGAGKSIALDALGLCLGERSDPTSVRTGETKAELSAEFDIANNISAINYLKNFDFLSDDDEIQLVIRRIINADGKSKAYINGNTANLNHLKQLGSYLINIHGQSAHRELFKLDHQMNIVDSYGDLLLHRQNLKQLSNSIRETNKKLLELQQNKQQIESQKQLLQFQLEELTKVNPKEFEYEELEQEYNKLSNIDEIMTCCNESQILLRDSDKQSVLSQLRIVLHNIEKINSVDNSLQNVINMLQEAQISIEESYNEIHSYNEEIDYNPKKQNELEKRLHQYDEIAKKYHVTPEKVYKLFQEKQQEYENLNSSTISEEELQKNLYEITKEYSHESKNLSNQRKTVALNLADKITKHMRELAMPYGKFVINVNFNENKQPSELGNDEIQFLAGINPGQDPGILSNTVSGGELARISLAIQEIYAEKVNIPSIVFDEIDTGISGQTANVVGHLLKNLGKTTQVICVTHLPQVASQGDNQFKVSKNVINNKTETTMIQLDEFGRIEEIARLLSGDTITDNALASAKELLQQNN